MAQNDYLLVELVSKDSMGEFSLAFHTFFCALNVQISIAHNDFLLAELVSKDNMVDLVWLWLKLV